MESLADYIQWMGDYPFTATGFHEADALILCTLSYFDLSPVFEQPGEVRYVRDCQTMIDEGRVRVLITGKDMGYRRILELAAASRRYGELRMTDYVDLVRADPPMQFSAVCFHDPAELSFLAYRGTDSSLAGWKEDCMISFRRTEAQELALQYARERITADRRWRLGGHSKGGNLALYAAGLLEAEIWERVERVYILDAPGLCPEVMDLSCMERIDPKATRILPRFSVVGKLFEARITDTRIVQSSASAFLQHGLSSWGIDHGRLALAEENDPRSLWINQAVDGWVSEMSQEERVSFTDELFDALGAGGAKTLEEIEESGPEGYEAILRRLRESSESTKKILSDLPRQLVKAGILPPLRKN